MRAVRPLLSKEEFQTTQHLVEAFVHPKTGAGTVLHAELQAREARAMALRALGKSEIDKSVSCGGENTVSFVQPFWEDMYLSGRYPLPINSNPGLLLQPDRAERPVAQVDRAAMVSLSILQVLKPSKDFRS